MSEIITAENPFVPILTEIKKIAPEAHIAGGYLRDLDNGKKPNDVDIFIESGSRDINDIADIVRRTHSVEGDMCEDDPTYDAHTGNIASSWKWMDKGGVLPPVNVIKIDNLKGAFQNIEKFDFGICQIAFDGHTIIRTAEYREDQAEQKFTLVSCLNSLQFFRSMKRFARLQIKYPEWMLYVPKKFRALNPAHVDMVLDEEIPF